MVLVRARERALLVPKKRVLNKMLGQSRTIKSDKGLIAARRPFVNHPRQHILSRSRGALQQNANLRSSNAFCQFEHPKARWIDKDIGRPGLRCVDAGRGVLPACFGKVIDGEGMGGALVKNLHRCRNVSRGHANDQRKETRGLPQPVLLKLLGQSALSVEGEHQRRRRPGGRRLEGSWKHGLQAKGRKRLPRRLLWKASGI